MFPFKLKVAFKKKKLLSAGTMKALKSLDDALKIPFTTTGCEKKSIGSISNTYNLLPYQFRLV